MQRASAVLAFEQQDRDVSLIVQEDHVFCLVRALESERLSDDAVPTRSEFAVHLLLHTASSKLTQHTTARRNICEQPERTQRFDRRKRRSHRGSAGRGNRGLAADRIAHESHRRGGAEDESTMAVTTPAERSDERTGAEERSVCHRCFVGLTNSDWPLDRFCHRDRAHRVIVPSECARSLATHLVVPPLLVNGRHDQIDGLGLQLVIHVCRLTHAQAERGRGCRHSSGVRRARRVQHRALTSAARAFL